MTASFALHVVTVGRSVLDRLESDLPQLRDVLLPELLTPSSVADTLRELAVGGDIEPTAVLPDDDATEAIRAADWTWSAEWTSLASYPMQHGAVVYLASDTDVGLRAATVLGLHHTKPGAGYDSVIRYVHGIDPESPVADHDGRITLVRLPGLDFSSPAGSGERTWQALGDLGHALAKAARSQGWPIVLHLSGGFKAAIPYLLVMAEGVRTRLKSGGPVLDVSAVCVHESSIRTGNPYLVQLPVGYLSGSVRDALLAPTALEDTEWRGQFTVDATPSEPARFTWAGLILRGVLRSWP